MRLKDKVVVITGASSGMGKAMVVSFIKEGAKVVAVARREERLKELKEEINSENFEYFVGDISLKEVNEKMIDFALEKFGAFDCLVNNAGIMDDMSAIGDATDEKYEKVMKTNFYGPFCAIRKAVNVFKERNIKGSIINISSVGGFHSCAGAIYCASKAALISLTRNTAYMYMPLGIRCNTIAPGGIETEISTSMGMPNMEGYGRVQSVLACAPKMGSANQIANVALFLASDESDYVNGVVLPVDGGWDTM